MNKHVRAKDHETAMKLLTETSNEDLDAMYDKYWPELDLYPDIREDECAVACYMSYRESGGDVVFSAMSAARKCAGTKGTTASFMEHARQRMNNMSDPLKNAVFGRAKQAGIDIQGKVHMSGLGPPDDPAAWVSDTSDILKVCRERNLTCTGVVNHQGVTKDPEFVELAEDLIDDVAEQEFQADPGLRQRCEKDQSQLRRLRGKIREKYGTPKSERPTRLTTRDG